MNGSQFDIEPLLKRDAQTADMVSRYKAIPAIDLITQIMVKKYAKAGSLDWLQYLPSQHPDMVRFREEFDARALLLEAPADLFDPRVLRAWIGYDASKMRELALDEAELPRSILRFVSAKLKPKKAPKQKDNPGQMVVPGTNDSGDPPAIATASSPVDGEPLPSTLAVNVTADGKARLNEKVYPRGFPEVGIIAISSVAKCSGVLVAPTMIVTAAHCVSDVPATSVSFFVPADTGPDQLKVSQTLQRKGRQYNVSHTLLYPKRGEVAGDVALLFLATPVSSVLKFPVLLSQPARDKMDITFVAFGKSGTNATDEFRELQIGWQSVRTRTKDSPLLVWDYYTGDTASSTCLGDSGAPLYYGTHRGKIGESRVLVGIVSSRQESCESGAGYSNLLDGTLRAWICDSTRAAWPYLCTRA